MKWKWSSKYGFPSLMTKNEAPGTIELREKKNDNIHTTQLRRLEINESARQLGIILPINGTFQQEYEKRLLQSQELGRNLYNSPLNHYESVIVYRMYYIPKISFPLSTTQFTMKQSKEIQSKFYRYALPKMGLNRHTPHAIIFGPAAMGSLELHDVYCD